MMGAKLVGQINSVFLVMMENLWTGLELVQTVIIPSVVPVKIVVKIVWWVVIKVVKNVILLVYVLLVMMDFIWIMVIICVSLVITLSVLLVTTHPQIVICLVKISAKLVDQMGCVWVVTMENFCKIIYALIAIISAELVKFQLIIVWAVLLQLEILVMGKIFAHVILIFIK